MNNYPVFPIKPSDFYQSLNSWSWIDNFLESLKYYRAELSTVFDKLSSIVQKGTDNVAWKPETEYQNFHVVFSQFVQKFNVVTLKTMAHGVEDSGELRNIVDKIQKLLQSLDHRLQINPPKTVASLQLTFELMKSVELSQIDILLWGLITISKNIKEQATRRVDTTRNSDRVTLVIDDERDLTHARDVIEEWQIELYGQGIFDTEGQLIETEILMRVKDREGIMMNPEAFLKFVKKAGYIEKLDWMIVSLSFMFVSNNNVEGSISINVNPNTMQDERFVEKIKTLAQIHGIDPKKIIIELLEYESSINVVHTNQVIRELRALGFRIAIDDFPSGYNTLGDISKFLDIDIIKIDGPHVMEIFKVCSTCHAIWDCMTSLETTFWHDQRCVSKFDMMYDLETLIFSLKFLKLQSPNVTFFAERVEDESVFNFLKQLDLISGYQGYFFEKPKHLFEGGKEENRARIEEGSLAIRFNASSIKVEKASKSQLPEVKKEIIQIYIQQLEEYTEGLLHLNSVLSIRELTDSSMSDELNITLSKVIRFLWGDSLNFYFLDEEKKNFHVKNISITKGNFSTKIPLAIDDLNRVDKEYVNLYTLLQNTPDFEKSGFQIASTAVPGLGDDVVVRVSDGIYLGLDDSESAMDYSKNVQINFLLLFVMIIRNKIEAAEPLELTFWS